MARLTTYHPRCFQFVKLSNLYLLPHAILNLQAKFSKKPGCSMLFAYRKIARFSMRRQYFSARTFTRYFLKGTEVFVKLLKPLNRWLKQAIKSIYSQKLENSSCSRAITRAKFLDHTPLVKSKKFP